MAGADRIEDYTPAEAALAEYLDRNDRNERIDREQFLAEHPDVAAELRGYFDDLDTVHRALGETCLAPGPSDQAPGRGFPRDFGAYALLEKLGAGGMGEVYKAEHRHMQRVVAVKMLHSKTLDSPATVERFHREVRAAAKLSHPNVVTAYDAGEVDGVQFLAMEYVDGGDLHELVARSGPLAVEQAVDYIVQAARGLEYAHRRQVIHRDVKPANLLLDREGTVKLLDLGLARFETLVSGAAATGGGSLTELGQIMGTADYMSPEQALDTKRAGAPADIYSLGCTLFFLLSGRTMYEGRTPIERIVAHREQPIPSLRDIRSDVPEALDAVFQRMVAKRPEDRPASMTEVLGQLGLAAWRERFVRAGPWPYPSADAWGADSNRTSSAARAHGGTAKIPTRTLADDSSLGSAAPRQPTSGGSADVRPKTRRSHKRAILVGTLAAAALAAVVWTVVLTSGTKELDARLVPLKTAAPGGQKGVVHRDKHSLAQMLASGEWEWAPPENLGPIVNSGTYDGDPDVSRDGLTLMFGSWRRGGYGKSDLYMCRRPTINDPWSEPRNLGPPINSGAHESRAAVSADGLTLVFTFDDQPGGKGGGDLRSSTRPSREAAWEEPIAFEFNTADWESDPFLTADGLSLLFSNGPDLMICTRESSAQSWSTPASLGQQVNSGGYVQRGPWLSDDGLVLLFYRADADQKTFDENKSHDLWMSTRGSTDEAWAPPVKLGINSSERDVAPSYSPGEQALYFASERPGGHGGMDLWMSRLVKKQNGPESDLECAARGGSFGNTPRSLRSALRSDHEPHVRTHAGGFRVVRRIEVPSGKVDAVHGPTNPPRPISP